jgi:hypothetical protein
MDEASALLSDEEVYMLRATTTLLWLFDKANHGR